MAFAPQSIRIRYGDNGSLAAGAAAAGGAQNFARQKALDMQFLNAEANRRHEAELATQQMAANRLQLAAKLASQRVAGNPTQASAGGSPFAAAVQASKQAALQQAVARGEISPDDPVVNLVANSPDASAGALANVIEDRKRQTKKQAEQSESRKAKENYLAGQSEEVRRQLAPMLDDDAMTLSQVRTAANAIEGRQAAEGKSLRHQKVSGVETEMRRTARQMEGVESALTDLGGSVHNDPASMNPTHADPEQNVFSTFGFTSGMAEAQKNLGEMVGADAFVNRATPYQGTLVSGGNAEQMKLFTLYYQLKRQYDQLAAQRAEMLNSTVNATKGDSADASKLSDAELLAALSK